jgi:hypothetical protein
LAADRIVWSVARRPLGKSDHSPLVIPGAAALLSAVIADMKIGYSEGQEEALERIA